MSIRVFVLICLLPTVFLPALTGAQQPGKIPRVSLLSAGSFANNSARIEAFGRGLREVGYTEGKNITIEYRFADGKVERLPDVAAELVRRQVDVIVAGGGQSTGAAKNVTETIPIVMVAVTDPVAQGFVASLARPGGNITGLTTLAPELGGKRLELLKEVVPGLSRVVVLGFRGSLEGPQMKEIEVAAQALGLQLQPVRLQASNDLENTFSAITKARAGALIGLSTPEFSFHRRRIAELAVKNRLPTVYRDTEFVDAGGLMSYGPNYADLYRRAATYVDKILKGAKPAELPVEQPTKFEFIINLKTAKQIGVTIPPEVLMRADKVIK